MIHPAHLAVWFAVAMVAAALLSAAMAATSFALESEWLQLWTVLISGVAVAYITAPLVVPTMIIGRELHKIDFLIMSLLWMSGLGFAVSYPLHLDAYLATSVVTVAFLATYLRLNLRGKRRQDSTPDEDM